jgi:hypothetical protein
LRGRRWIVCFRRYPCAGADVRVGQRRLMFICASWKFPNFHLEYRHASLMLLHPERRFTWIRPCSREDSVLHLRQ